jgi:plastocyanin
MTARILNNVRIIPRESDYLDRKLGSRGEVFFDRESKTLRLFDGETQGGIPVAKADLTNIANSVFLAKATAAGVSGGGGASGNSFTTIAVTGQSNVVADSATDTLTLTAGTGISITTNATTDTITIASVSNFGTIAVAGQSNVVADQFNDTITLAAGSNITIETDPLTDTVTISAAGVGGASNSFTTVAVAGQSNVIADSTTDTLTLAAGAGMSITTNPSTDTITIASTVTSGATSFTNLTDIAAAGLTVDMIYLQAITRHNVSNTGATAYLFDQYSGNNPTVFVLSGTTVAFKLTAQGHPFLIQDPTGTEYNTGLVHVSTSGVVSTGASAQGKDSGTLYWKIPYSLSGNYRYQCGAHLAMVGAITIKNFGSI